MEPIKHFNFRFNPRRWALGFTWDTWHDDTTICLDALCFRFEIHTNP